MGKLHYNPSILPKEPPSRLIYGWIRPIEIREVARLSVSESPTVSKPKVSRMRRILTGETVILPKVSV